jgi:hypothetical protein
MRVGHFAAPSAQPEERQIYPLTEPTSSGLASEHGAYFFRGAWVLSPSAAPISRHSWA